MNIAIITGASSGIGQELARQLDKELGKTDEIWLLARRKDPMEELAGTMKIKTRTIAIDITNQAAMKQFGEILSIEQPKITVLANCAGIGSYGEFLRQNSEDISAMVKLNIVALTQMTKMCLPYMKKGSSIIQFASGAAFVPQADFAVYAATKAYVYSLSRALQKELKPRGIRVMTVCPGPVDTPFLAHAYGAESNMNGLKKLTMVKTECVVKKVIEDCKHGRTVSVCGLPMKLLYMAAQGIQNIIQAIM